jgi:CRISPR-associated endonuclease/helicase Cas3
MDKTLFKRASGAANGTNKWLREALGLREEDSPFPWQIELFRRFANGKIERSLDIPTGLGKTAVMAIWLVARAHGAALPRRLVYVVDRRAVVDQATEVADGLRNFVDRTPEIKRALDLGERSLPVSTLRGQHVDNREWLNDPACAAIIVGTVDMIGSRLLFEGYGTSRKMRPYHAGLLGADTLVVLDEAHLVPPFEKLIEAVAEGQSAFGPRSEILQNLVPPFKLVALSATGRAVAEKPFRLQEADLKHPIVKKRLEAPKRLTLLPPPDKQIRLSEALARQAWKLTNNGTLPVRCIVFCDKREDAKDTLTTVKGLANGDKKSGIPNVEVDTQLFVGGRRVFEREEAAQWLRERGFIAGTRIERKSPAFVFATSAGEVGVDLDADHMVSDLVAWERMVQRLGRVNRRGEGAAEVVVVDQPTSNNVEKALTKPPADRNATERNAIADSERKNAVRKLLKLLPEKLGARDASLGALRTLKMTDDDAELTAILDAATTPAPLRPALSRALVDAWSMTSLKEHTGRPEIDPWLRGWVADDRPQSTVVWRTYLPIRIEGGAATEKEIEAFFEAAPPHVSEMLETETFRVVGWLRDRANELVAPPKDSTSTTGDAGSNHTILTRKTDVISFALTHANDLLTTLRLDDLATDDKDKAAIKKSNDDLERKLVGATLIVDARIGGLTPEGLLDASVKHSPRTADDGNEWMSGTTEPVVRFRVLSVEGGAPPSVHAQWCERLRFATELSNDGEPVHWFIVQKWRGDSATENDRAVGRPQFLKEHQAWTEERARSMTRRLSLPDEYVEMLATAARLHDEGKQARRWQRAFNAQLDGVYAKTLGPINVALLDGYRHEFGSLPFAAKDSRLRELPQELQDLALHLIAAHHGFARPVIRVDGCEDEPPSVLEERAREIALRFARLQKRWGPWGLAWWEALLRAADQQASRDNDAVDSTARKESL